MVLGAAVLALASIGAAFGQTYYGSQFEGWGERLRRGFVHFLEDTVVENLEVRPGPHRCCH
jgi:hypothetical protein